MFGASETDAASVILFDFRPTDTWQWLPVCELQNLLRPNISRYMFLPLWW